MPSSTTSRAAVAAISSVIVMVASRAPRLCANAVRAAGAPSRQVDRRHARAHGAGTPDYVGRTGAFLEAFGRPQHRGGWRGLGRAEPGRRDMKVVPRRRLGTEDAFAPFDVVQ